MFPQVDLNAESTWRNYPRPAGFPSFERELKVLGGTHPNGRDMLRLKWAPEHFRVQLGRPRCHYVDSRIPTRKRTRRIYYQVKDLTDPFAPWITVEPENLGNYPGEAFLHLVHHDTEIVTISRQQWVIEQYMPPNRIGDTPASWERKRFRMFTPPETNVPIWGDDIGPFPSEGRYECVLILEGAAEYSYRQPCERDLLFLKGAMRERERYRRTVSREKEIENEFDAAEEADRKRLDAIEDQLEHELKPYVRDFEGNAFVSVPETYKKKSPIVITDL